jgi:hypothetical protein
VQFDVRQAKLLKSGQHLVVGGCSGLRLEATPSTKTRTYRYKSPGKRRIRGRYLFMHLLVPHPPGLVQQPVQISITRYAGAG